MSIPGIETDPEGKKRSGNGDFKVLPFLPSRGERAATGLCGKPCALPARLLVVALFAAFVSSGCTFFAIAPATVARMDGFDAQWRGFNSLKTDRFDPYETEIRIKVIVVDDMSAIGYPGAVATYSHPEGAIRIVGKKINGKIVLCPAVLGHEVQHALEYQDGGFANPDKLEEFGY
ncbi:MAG: hypothetical protein M1418_09550 [Deltaproteobacteria bacterium]|nr:hypothetical protein [Deltaproteobacteria bacterium]